MKTPKLYLGSTFLLKKGTQKLTPIFKNFSGADPALVIRVDLIQNISCQILGNYSKEASFF